jgi:hypothetical protein
VPAEAVAEFEPGQPPAPMIEKARGMGAACVAAHPTRAGLGFDEEISELDLDGLEVASTNLKPHEQRLAINLAQGLNKPMTAASDAHRLDAVGAYATEFHDPIRSMPDFVAAVKHGRVRPAHMNQGTDGTCQTT